MMNGEQFDVLVVGGGPAGSTTAALLAAEGHTVLVLEKEPFPRFHIGESLLPVCLPVLDRLGVEPDPETFVYKSGAEFIDEPNGARRRFDFNDALAGCRPHAWQVDRARFDSQLRDRAAAAGARFMHNAKVVRVDLHDDRVAVHTRGGERVTGRYLIDASGQNRVLARRHDSARPLRNFGRTAAYMHIADLDYGEGQDIRVLISEHGWSWLIPLPGRRLSVGLVCRGTETATAALARHIDHSPILQRLIQEGTAGEVQLGRNFSFINTRPHGVRFCCVGDAAGFLDPVFSSGVSLALIGGQHAADLLAPALRERREADATLMDPHAAFMEVGYRIFASMIDRFYNTRFVEHFIFGPQDTGRIHREIVTVLAGDIWREDNDFQSMLRRSRRRELY